MRVGGRREGARERALVHSAVATTPVLAAAVAPAHHTPSYPPSFSQVNGYMTAVDARRVHPRYCASRGGQCASRVLLGGLGGQLLAEKGQVAWEWDIARTQCSWRA